MSVAAIGIIGKAPQPGRAKTRLAAAIGAVAASELSACFLRDVAAAIEAVPETLGRRGYGVYAPAGAEPIMRQLLPATFGFLLQVGDDLGDVLFGAARDLEVRWAAGDEQRSGRAGLAAEVGHAGHAHDNAAAVGELELDRGRAAQLDVRGDTGQ